MSQTVVQIHIAPGDILTDHSTGEKWFVVAVDQANAGVGVVPVRQHWQNHHVTWFPASQFSPVRAPMAVPTGELIDVPVPKPHASPFKVGDRVICVDGKILGVIEAVDCDALHSILIRDDGGHADHWLPEAFRLATWRDEKPLL